MIMKNSSLFFIRFLPTRWLLLCHFLISILLIFSFSYGKTLATSTHKGHDKKLPQKTIASEASQQQPKIKLVAINPEIVSENGNKPFKRLQIRIVGSSTVYPFSDLVKMKFSQKTSYIEPYVASTGTTVGIQEFCRGIGKFTPDILNASRALHPQELQLCHKNNVMNISEVTIGYDGLVVACSNKNRDLLDLTVRELFLAITEKIYDEKQDKMVFNPYKKWRDINPRLPNIDINFKIPGKDHGTRDAFEALIMEQGGKRIPYLAKMADRAPAQFTSIVTAIRKDGVVTEISNYEAADDSYLLFEELQNNPDIITVVSMNLINQNARTVRPVLVDSVEPTKETIQNHTYSLSRKLYMYVKDQNRETTQGIQAFLDEFSSPDATSMEDGYLSKAGLTPLLK